MRWHHWLDGHEFEGTLGVGDGQGGLKIYVWKGKNANAQEKKEAMNQALVGLGVEEVCADDTSSVPLIPPY